MTDSYLKREWLRKLKRYNIEEEHYDKVKEKLETQTDHEISEEDVIWNLLKMVESDLESHQDLKDIYFDTALFLFKQERDEFYEYLKKSKEMELLEIKEIGIVDKVEIMAADESCESCKKLNGQIFELEVAMKEMPIPNEDCTTWNPNKGWCRCLYQPVVE